MSFRSEKIRNVGDLQRELAVPREAH